MVVSSRVHAYANLRSLNEISLCPLAQVPYPFHNPYDRPYELLLVQVRESILVTRDTLSLTKRTSKALSTLTCCEFCGWHGARFVCYPARVR